MANSDFSIALRNYAGVPVVDLVGEMNKETLAKLEDILRRLIRAGHYHVMINFKRAALHNLRSLAPLEKAAKSFQSHYGELNLVAESEQIGKLLKSEVLAKAFHLCTSEGQALARIRRIPRVTASGVKPTSARL